MRPNFSNPQGCTAYLRITATLEIALTITLSNSKKSINCEPAPNEFSQDIVLALRNIPVKGLNAIFKYVTLAYITALLVALTAVKTGNNDKIHHFKSFIKNL